MQSNSPKDDSQYQWTNHVKGKMMRYRLSGSLIKSIINHPKRREEGIAQGTVAVMKSSTSKKKSEEIWVMYRVGGRIDGGSGFTGGGFVGARKKKTIISAWRYPGVSLVGKAIHIPDDVLEELERWFEK